MLANFAPDELRNNYRGWPHVLMFWVKTAWFYSFTRPQPRRLLLSARGFAAALRGELLTLEELSAESLVLQIRACRGKR